MDDEPADLSAALSEYADTYLPARNLSRRTRKEYLFDLTQALEFLSTQLGIDTVDEVDTHALEGFLAELDGRGLKGSSRRRKVSSLKSFFAYLSGRGIVAHDPTRKLIPPIREHAQPRVLTEPEFKRLQLSCAHDTRDSAVIELILQTGMRLSEVAAVRIPDLELPARPSRESPPGAIHVHGKGRKERTITLNWKVCKAIKSWLASFGSGAGGLTQAASTMRRIGQETAWARIRSTDWRIS